MDSHAHDEHDYLCTENTEIYRIFDAQGKEVSYEK